MHWIDEVTEDSVRLLKLNRGVTNALNEEDIQTFLKMWYSEEARERLKEAMKKF
jgi:hypothetical protein